MSTPAAAPPSRRRLPALVVTLVACLLTGGAVAVPAHAAPPQTSPTPVPAPPSFVLTELSAPADGTAGYALALSPGGDVLGTARTGTARLPQLATRWDDGGATSLGSLPGSTFSRVFAEDLLGRAVGEATAADGSTRAVLVERDGQVRDLGTLTPGAGAVATDISRRGVAVGVSGGSAVVFPRQPARYPSGRTGGPVALPPLEEGVAGSSRAEAVNAGGQVVGSAPAAVDGSTTAVGQAVLWAPRGRTYVAAGLDRLAPGRYARALDVDSGGSAVGEASRDAGGGTSVTRAVRWDGRRVEELAPVGGLRHTRATAVADSGDVVGHATGFYGFPTIDGVAVLWRDGTAYDLNDFVQDAGDLVLRSAEDVDDAGRVVGYGTVGGQTRAFLLTPS